MCHRFETECNWYPLHISFFSLKGCNNIAQGIALGLRFLLPESSGTILPIGGSLDSRCGWAESKRGAMLRSDRSVLSPKAQPFQDFIDAVLFALAGLTKDEVAGLRVRYEAMKKVK